MKNSATNIVLALISVCLLAGCANNRDDRREGPKLSPERKAQLYDRFVRRWDLNADSQVTCEDVNLQRRALFAVLDADSDNQLTSSEYRYVKFEDKSFLFHLFSDVDRDSSGAISLSELNDVKHSQFVSLDKNNDCIISEAEAEVEARERARDGRARPEGGGRGGRGGKRPTG